jgi:hypothetical protein
VSLLLEANCLCFQYRYAKYAPYLIGQQTVNIRTPTKVVCAKVAQVTPNSAKKRQVKKIQTEESPAKLELKKAFKEQKFAIPRLKNKENIENVQ